jgi:hypothetical protein
MLTDPDLVTVTTEADAVVGPDVVCTTDRTDEACGVVDTLGTVVPPVGLVVEAEPPAAASH